MTPETLAAPTTITQHEAEQVERANASGLTPVVFVHGLWLLPRSWDRWVSLFGGQPGQLPAGGAAWPSSGASRNGLTQELVE